MKPELGESSLVIVPTYNERSNIRSLVDGILTTAPAAHVLVVDDNSPDGTGAAVEAIARDDSRVMTLRRPAKLGLGTAYLEGFRLGIRHGFTRFFEMDADLSHDPAHLPSFFAALDQGADVVLGSRNIPGGGIEGWGLGRHLLSKGGSLYSRFVLGVAIHDLTTGYKAFSRQALDLIDLDRVHSNGYSFQIEMTYRALCRGLKVVETPIVFTDRRAGQSKMDARIFAEAMVVVWRLRFEALARRL